MDLFTPIIPTAKQHPNFARMLDELHVPVRAVIQEWAAGYANPNENFIQDFQRQFDPQFWELYLHAAFKHLRFDICQPNPAPDFVLGTPYGHISVEAAVTSHPQNGIPAFRTDLLLTDLRDRTPNDIVELATLRLCQTIKKKHDKYLENYQLLPGVPLRPFVLAVAPFDQPSAWSQNIEAITRVLYGFRLKRLPDGFIQEILETEVLRPGSSPIPVGVFMNDHYKELSAIIYSNTATMGKARALSADTLPWVFKALRFREAGPTPYEIVASKPDYNESLLDGLYVFHNPYAIKPLDNRTFFGREVNQFFYDRNEEIFSTDAVDGHLIQRICMLGVTKEMLLPDAATQ